MEKKEKSLAEIEFEIFHDAWIDVQYQGPLLTPDGHENKYAIFRKSQEVAIGGWINMSLNDPQKYRKPTEEEVKILAKNEYDRLYKDKSILQPTQTDEQDFLIKPNETDSNCFIRNGDFWQIRYDGKERPIKNLDGIYYIALLLQKPGASISCRKLYQAASGKMPDKFLSEGSALDEGLYVDHKKQAISDPKAKRDYWKQWQELQADIGNAEDSPEGEMVKKESKKKQDEIMPFLEGRAFPDKDTKKVQSNIQKRLKVAYNAIDKAGMKNLEKHLRAHIKPDDAYGLMYTGSLSWDITL